MDDAQAHRIANILKKAHGHLGKVISMTEGKANPMSIIQQSLAVQGFIKTVNGLILESYLDESIENVLKSKIFRGTKKKKVIKDILKLYDMAKR